MLSSELIQKTLHHKGEIVVVSQYLEEALVFCGINLKKSTDKDFATTSICFNKSIYTYSRNWEDFNNLPNKTILKIVSWIAKHQKLKSREKLLNLNGESFNGESFNVFSTDLAIYFIPQESIGAIYPFHYEGAHQYTTASIKIYDKQWAEEFSENTIALKWGIKEGKYKADKAFRDDLLKSYRKLFIDTLNQYFYPAGEGYWLSKNDNDFNYYIGEDVENEISKLIGDFEYFVFYQTLPNWKKKLLALNVIRE